MNFHFTRPLGFDLEWRVMWQAGAPERRTALVQLCDTRTVLLIQVSSMKSADFSSSPVYRVKSLTSST